MQTELKFPFYAKASLICLGLFAFFTMLSLAGGIIVPIIFATLAAVVLSPLVGFLVRKRINRVLAIAMVLLTVGIILVLLTILLSNQLILFGKSVPALIENFKLLVNDMIGWFAGKLNITVSDVNLWLDTKSTEMIDGASSKMGQTLLTTGGMLIFVILIPVYVFMLLFYQPLLIEFIHKLFSRGDQGDVNDVISKTKKIIKSYLLGLLTEAIIIAVLYSIALLILGIEYAILLAVIGALLNLIPYLGAIIAASLPMAIALATKLPLDALLVLGSYVLIQFVDNNYIIPKIVASKVRINALVSIVVVIIGGALWGISGMFLAIPLTAILKVIFDHVDGLKPWGHLLGNAMPVSTLSGFIKRKMASK